jgi:hypothetical protein
MNKLLTIGIICMFIITGFTSLPSSGIQIDKTNITEKSTLDITRTTEYWAILVAPSDGLSYKPNETGYYRFVRTASHLNEILLESGWKEENTITLFSENATKENLLQSIDMIAEKDAPSDTVLIYLNDHGGNGSFVLNDTFIDYQELDKAIDKLDSINIGIIINACHSGSAIPYLQQKGRIIVTSSRANEISGIENELYTGFIGFADKKQGIGDNNGMISLEEAFNFWMDERYPLDYVPQIKDDIIDQLNLITLNTSDDRIDQLPTNNTEDYDTSTEFVINNFALAQSFKPTMNVLTKIKLLMNTFLLEEKGPLIISIRKNLNGEDLTSVEFYPNISKQHWWTVEYQEFDFEDINVNPGDTYFIVCKTLNNSVLTDYTFYGRDNDDYIHGKCFTSGKNGSSNWTDSKRISDLLFTTYGKNTNENLAPYVPKRPFGNVYIEKNSVNNYYIKTEDNERDQIFYNISWGDGTYSGWIGPSGSDEVIFTNHSWTKEDIYYIKVKAKDEHGSESDWSSNLKITTIPNHAPEPDKPYRKLWDWLFDKYIFFKATDPDEDVVYYNISWGDGTHSGWIGPGDSDEEFYTNHTWNNSRVYKIRVKIMDKRGAESNWSKPYIIFIPEHEGKLLLLLQSLRIIFERIFMG